MSRASLKADVATVVADAEALIAGVAAGEFTVSTFEPAVNSIRTRMADLVAQLEAEWGVGAVPTVAALRQLGVSLLDLRSQVQEGNEVIVEVVDRVTSLLELAWTWYGDAARWVELAAMNPGLRHPAFLVAGDQVVRHAQ